MAKRKADKRTNVFMGSSAAAPFDPPGPGGNSPLKKLGAQAGKDGSAEREGGVNYRADAKTAMAMPILRTKDGGERLVCYITERLQLADIERQSRIQRAQSIDIQVSGYISLDRDDAKRDRENKQGKAPKPTKHNLPLVQAQLDEAVTFLMGVFAPDMDIFTAASSANKQPIAEGLTKEINAQGQRVGYYRHFAKFCNNCIRYNFGGLTVNWEKEYGVDFKVVGAGQIEKNDGALVWQGNVLKSIDVYNFMFDTTVHPVDLARKGEYFAEIEVITPFRARKLAKENKLYGIDRFLTTDNKPTVTRTKATSFYQMPPTIRDAVSTNNSKGTNWQALLSEQGAGIAAESNASLEKWKYTTWIVPSEFGLSDSNEMELWRIEVMQSSYITLAYKLDDSHGMLPIGMSTPIEDDLNNDQRTYAEQLLPLQHFGSFILNTHQDATRKGVYGISIFDPRAFPNLDKSTEDLVAARIPIRSSAGEVDIDKVFRHYNATPGTEGNVPMMEKLNELMQKILPTDQARQVADLERATLYQAAATVQASSRRNLKIARIISDQGLTIVKLLMMYGIYANLTSITVINQADGSEQEISPSDIVGAKIELDVGTGLKGIDRLMQLQIFQYITNSVIQSQQGIQEIDLVKLLTYVANLAGDKTDLSQFRRVGPPSGQQPAPQAPAGVPTQ